MTEPGAEVDVHTDTATDPGSDLDAHPDAVPDPGSGSDAHADTTPDPGSDLGAHVDATPDPGSGTDTHPDTPADTPTDPEPALDALADGIPDSGAALDTSADANPGADAGPLPDAPPDTQGETDPIPDTEADPTTAADVPVDTGPLQLSGNPCTDNPWGCNPVNGEGCDGLGACDWGEIDGVQGFACFADPAEPEGAACEPTSGPWCAAGMTCADHVCRKYCCGAADCDGTACVPPSPYWPYVTGDLLGLCELPPLVDGCEIGGTWYANGTPNPANPCLKCNALVREYAWSGNNGAACDDGVFCNGADTCDSGGCWAHAGSPCPDDGTFCNGAETCNEATDVCLHASNPCPDNGTFCDGVETCDEAARVCGHAGNPCPDDGVFCTGVESCDEVHDACIQSGTPCPDDGAFCNGTTSCDEVHDTCAFSGIPCLDDGEFCNGSESCDEVHDTCAHSGDPCASDSLFCNGVEYCDVVAAACASPGTPCLPGDVCSEAEGACCVPNDHRACDPGSGDVYWFDSCDHVGELADDCSTLQTCQDGACACPAGDCENCVVYVNKASGNDANDGRSWSQALATVVRGLLLADYYGGCEIWVAQGQYVPTTGNDRTASFRMISGVDLYGGFAGGETKRDQRDWSTHVTILTGNVGGGEFTTDNSYHVIKGANNAVLDGFTISDGEATGTGEDGNGGGLYNNAASPTVRNCTFRANHAYKGGAIYNVTSSPTVTSCLFDDNRAVGSSTNMVWSVYGGAVYNGSTSSLIIESSTFQGNQATITFSNGGASTYGGAIYNVSNSPIEIRACIFIGNKAFSHSEGLAEDALGGAIYVSGASAIVEDCRFETNSTYTSNYDVRSFGGAIYQSGGSNVQYTRCIFSGNTAKNAYDGPRGEGGAAYAYLGATALFTDCTFSDNSVDGRGGAIYGSLNSISIVGAAFSGNHATIDGGAIYATNWSTTPGLISSCSFTANTSSGYGGALRNESTLLTIEDCSFSGNKASSGGGAASTASGKTSNFSRCSFTGNTTSGYGGAVHGETTASSRFASCSFLSNQATSDGGAVYGPIGRAVNCAFEGNLANRHGGAIYGHPASLANVAFNGNRALQNGGAIVTSSTTASLIDACTFMGNPSIGGGALTCTAKCNVKFQNSILFGNAPAELAPGTGTISALNCDIKGGWAGTGNLDTNPGVLNAPIETTFVTSTGSTTTVVTAATSLVFNGYVIEIGDDGVMRTITGLNGTQFTFTPALAAPAKVGTRVDIWGAGATNLVVDYRLKATSPCWNAGDASLLPADLTDLDADGDTSEPIPYDLDGKPRVVGASVDLGAYERQ